MYPLGIHIFNLNDYLWRVLFQYGLDCFVDGIIPRQAAMVGVEDQDPFWRVILCERERGQEHGNAYTEKNTRYQTGSYSIFHVRLHSWLLQP